ncbi:hypothetical protein GCM10009555_057910 [Acrocarpospora macrocephala]
MVHATVSTSGSTLCAACTSAPLSLITVEATIACNIVILLTVTVNGYEGERRTEPCAPGIGRGKVWCQL